MRDKHTLPNISEEALDAYKRHAASDLHVAQGLKPWEISPLALHLFHKPTEKMLSGRDRIWWSSWAKANRLREELEAACEERPLR